MQEECRYKGYADLLRMFGKVGLLNNGEEDKILFNEWRELVGRAASKAIGETFEAKETPNAVISILGNENVTKHNVIPALEWYVSIYLRLSLGTNTWTHVQDWRYPHLCWHRPLPPACSQRPRDAARRSCDTIIAQITI